MEIKRGDMFYISGDIETYDGYRLSGHICLVVSNNTNNTCSDSVMIVTLTSKLDKMYPTDCEVMCRVPSRVMCNRIYTISREDLVDYIRTCTSEEMEKVNKCLAISLQIDEDRFGISHEMQTAKDDTALQIAEHERGIYKELYDRLLEKALLCGK